MLQSRTAQSKQACRVFEHWNLTFHFDFHLLIQFGEGAEIRFVLRNYAVIDPAAAGKVEEVIARFFCFVDPRTDPSGWKKQLTESFGDYARISEILEKLDCSII